MIDCQPAAYATSRNSWRRPNANETSRPGPKPQRTQNRKIGSIESVTEPPFGSSQSFR